MSGEKLQGLTLELGLDTLGIQDGMKDLKRQLGVVNSEMKANLSAFDKPEKSMQSYEAKIKGLNQRLKVQKQMFNQAESELKRLNINYEQAKVNIKGVENAYINLTEANKKNKVALDKSNIALKESVSELKKSEAQYKRLNQRKDEAYQKLKQLRQAEKDLKNSNSATTLELKRANDAIQKQIVKHKELVARYKDESIYIRKLREENKKLSTTNQNIKNAYTKTNNELKQTQIEYKELNNTIKNHHINLAKAQKAVNNEKASLNGLERAIAKTTDEMKAFNKEQLLANSHFTKLANQLDEVSGKYHNLSSGMISVGRNMSLYLTTPIAGAMGYAAKLGVTFDDSMRKVQATSGASGKELEQLKQKAREMGATTKFSASDSAEALNYMALAGWKSKEMIAGLPGIMNLAAASGEDLGSVSDIVTDSLTAFNMTAKDSGHFADVLAQTSASANTNVSGLGEAFKYIAPVAGALKYSIEDTSIAIGLMSNAGVKGEKAGTALRTMFSNLVKPSKEQSNVMHDLGISMTDSQGKMLPLRKLIDQLRKSFKGLSEAQQNSAATTIFGKEAMSGALAIINASESDYKKLTKAIDNSEGAAKKMSDTMEGGLGGSLRQLKSAGEELELSIYETLEPALSSVVKYVRNGVDYINKLPKGAKVAAVGLGVLAAATGPLIVGVGLLLRVVASAAKGYASLNRQMALNSTEAIINAKANKKAAGSILKSSKLAKRSSGLFGSFGDILSIVTGRFGGLGKIMKMGVKIFGKANLPLIILTTLFGIAYEKMDWFREGFKDMGRIIGDVASHINFDWIHDLGKAWDHFKTDVAKGLEDGALFKKIHKLFDGIHSLASKASDKVDVLGKGVSKQTKKALSTYMKYADQSDKIFEKIKYNHGKISKEEADEIFAINIKMSDELIDQLEKRKARELKIDEEVFKDTKVISEKRKRAILKSVEEEGNKRIGKIKDINGQIAALDSKYSSDGKLSDEEMKKLQDLYKQRNELAVKELSKGEKEQQRILSRMSANRKAMSIEEASEIIKESIKASEKAKKDAKKRYDSRVDEINEMVGLSKSEKDKLLKEADVRYKEEKDKADKHHKDILDGVKQSNKDVEKEIDLSNGNVKSGFDKFWGDFKKSTSENWGRFTHDLKEGWGTLVDTFEDYGKSIQGVGDWFSDLPEKTSKWFGKTRESVSNYTSDMYDKAKTKFENIKESAEENAKSVYDGFKYWLDHTLDWIRKIGSDMGSAALDLGKSVANKAIDGLNGMIGGINKISLAITDKTLIEPIPKLSTGTFSGTSLATDSGGGLKSPTLAIVNDRGTGNAPGGGVQEIIHRADGTLHAPKGRNVPVMLGVGDSVINANDTKRMQDMGLLPKFSTGTKKKSWLDEIKESLGRKVGNFGAKAKDTAHDITDGAEKIVEAIGDKLKDSASWLGDKIGDVWDYVKHPGKLIDKVMNSLGIDFGGGANATVKMAKGAFTYLKNKLIDKVKSWFDDFGGGDGHYLFDYPIWQRFGRYTGGLNFNGGRHYGVDFGMPAGTNIYAVKGGIADRVWTDFGGGNSIQIKTGANEWNWYMHLSKQIARQGQRIKAGQLIGLSGASGNFVRGAHLHFQLMRGSHPGNDTAVDPIQWLKSLKGAVSAIGGSGYNLAKSAILKAQEILGGQYKSPFITNEMLRVAKRESNYTSDAVNNWDINAQRGTPSKGMFQMIEPTFKAYALRGHENMFNTVDEAIAAMRYIVGKWVPIMGSWNSAFKRAGDYAYENGGLSTTHKLAQISEGDKPEMIVPLTKRTRAIQLIEQAMRFVGMESGSTNMTFNQDNSLVESLLKQLLILSDENNKLTEKLVYILSQPNGNIDLKGAEKLISALAGNRSNQLSYMQGGG
ncbi:phage tail tape measure protein [Staphylococcus pseudintermedius]|nr:phage tail tape measure protein [Staphylococcus pseudintermedius]